MPDDPGISVTADKNILRITLRRPPLNILGIPMLVGIRQAIEEGAKDPALRAVLFAAEGRAFSAGTDIKDHLPPNLGRMLGAFHAVFRALDTLGLPTVARVDGAALGGGCELACFCDWVFATPKSSFALPEIKLGAFPPAAAAFFQATIGARRAADLVLTGRTVMPEEAAAIGLITKVSATLAIDDDVGKVLDRLREMSPSALRTARRALRQSAGRPPAEALEAAERIYLAELPESPDMAEGMRAFIEKRAPTWRA